MLVMRNAGGRRGRELMKMLSKVCGLTCLGDWVGAEWQTRLAGWCYPFWRKC